MMRFLVLGAGLMGRAVAFDLMRNHRIESVILADSDASQLKEAEALINSPHDLHLHLRKTDVNDEAAVKELMLASDTVVSAVTYKYNYKLAKLAVICGCNFCDLGGNNTIVEEEFTLHERARKKNLTVIPDCGLAPGMVSVLVAHGMEKLDEAEDVQIRVGGLPIEPQPPLNYKLVFSVHGLINEYVEKCVKIRDGEIVEVDPMTEVEELVFRAPFGKLEAFNTSGGTSTLPKTFLGKAKNLDYKTIRYPGHCARFKLLMDLGLTGSKPVKVGDMRVVPRELLAQLLTEKLTMDGKDCVLVRVAIEGQRDRVMKKIQYEIIDYGDDLNNITAMMRLTAYPISVIAQMLSAGEITAKGAWPQEECVPPQRFIDELSRRGISINITSHG